MMADDENSVMGEEPAADLQATNVHKETELIITWPEKSQRPKTKQLGSNFGFQDNPQVPGTFAFISLISFLLRPGNGCSFYLNRGSEKLTPSRSHSTKLGLKWFVTDFQSCVPVTWQTVHIKPDHE